MIRIIFHWRTRTGLNSHRIFARDERHKFRPSRQRVSPQLYTKLLLRSVSSDRWPSSSSCLPHSSSSSSSPPPRFVSDTITTPLGWLGRISQCGVVWCTVCIKYVCLYAHFLDIYSPSTSDGDGGANETTGWWWRWWWWFRWRCLMISNSPHKKYIRARTCTLRYLHEVEEAHTRVHDFISFSSRTVCRLALLPSTVCIPRAISRIGLFGQLE